MGKTKTLAGPGRLGSNKRVKETLKKKGNPWIRMIPAENPLCVS
jgi:hypothetical protein